ncbi:MAG TPA: HTH domain-containing protein [Bacteroidales bacterium]|nr:HTH domain-containing protein [Bacteroidales bacterium]
MTFLELAERVLIEEKRPLTANEIWTLATEKGYDKQLNSEGKTPWATLGAQIYVNAKDNPKSPFAQTDSRPKKFYLKSQASQLDLSDTALSKEPTVVKKKRFDFLEKDLHPYLTYYAYYHLHCYTKTINHSQSSKKEFGEWVHPDIVGCYFPLDDWKQEVYELSSSIGNISIRLLSFELKREISFGNLRESFFQTVSNSSWANESYLVAAEVSKEEEFRNELARLSTSFGIRVIKLNLEDPHSSEIIFPAKYREALDWETINKLTMNADFKEFISNVKIDITSRKIHKKRIRPSSKY